MIFNFFTEVQEMEENLPKTCTVNFEDPNKLHVFDLTIVPDEGFWKSGKFKFRLDIPEEYNIVVSIHAVVFLFLYKNFEIS